MSGTPVQLNHSNIPIAVPALTDLFFFADPSLGLGKKNTLATLITLLGGTDIIVQANVDTTGITFTLPFANKIKGFFNGGTIIQESELLLGADTNALEFDFAFTIDSNLRRIFFPASFKTDDPRFDPDYGTGAWDPGISGAGLYLMHGDKIASNWFIETIRGPFV